MASWNLEGLTISELNDLAQQCQDEAANRKENEAKNAARELIAALDTYQGEYGNIELRIHEDLTLCDFSNLNRYNDDENTVCASDLIESMTIHQIYWNFNEKKLVISVDIE